MQRRMIIFEGIDGSGKTTLMNEYRKATKFYDYTIHRFAASKFVYAMLYKRPFSATFLGNDETLIQPFNPLYVFCKINPMIAHERTYIRGEFHKLTELTVASRFFDTYFTEVTKIPVLYIDTEEPITICLAKLLEYVRYNKTQTTSLKII